DGLRHSAPQSAREAFFGAFGIGAVADQLRGEGRRLGEAAGQLRQQSGKFVEENKTSLFWGAVGVVTIGPVITAGVMLAQALRGRSPAEGGQPGTGDPADSDSQPGSTAESISRS
ncbi:unnamed protein product, partial [Polarella glacialis]